MATEYFRWTTELDRRTFLRDLSLLTAGGGVLSACARTAPAMATRQPTAAGARRPSVSGIGVQLYTVSDQMRTDFDGTIEKVAQIGYRQVEFAGYFGRTPAQVRALLDRLQITAPSTHIAMELLRTQLDAQLQLASTIGHRYVTIPSLGRTTTLMNTADAWKRIAAECNAIGEQVRRAGMTLAFHSHSAEFVTVGDGLTGMDVFLRETDPSLITFELDLGWARVAGQDPVAWFRRYPGRFRMWHVKDFESLAAAQAREAQSLRDLAAGVVAPRPAAPASGATTAPAGPPAAPRGRPCPIGSGDIDFRPIIAAWQMSGVEHFFVEQDGAGNWPGGSLKSIETSFQTLKALLA